MELIVEQINRSVGIIAPEVILVATVCVLFLAGCFTVSPSGEVRPGLRNLFGIVALGGLGAAWLFWMWSDSQTIVDGPFRNDQLLSITRAMSLAAGALVALILWNEIEDSHAAESQACLLAIVAGVNLTAAANDLVSIFLALELVSIPTYVLLYLPRRDTAEREATIKYFLLSIFSSALVLYGMSWLYGAGGTTNLAGIGKALQSADSTIPPATLLLAQGLLIAGLSFRMTAFPFHFYAPDVFQAVIPANAALLSFVPKLVATVALLRFIPLTTGDYDLTHWAPNDSTRVLLAVTAVLSMFVGNLMARRQRNVYRLMAYSGVAHAGYMLVGLAVGHVDSIGGPHAVLFYLAAYALMTIGAIALFSVPDFNGRKIHSDSDLRGLSKTSPAAAFMLAICLLSLTGLPPTLGFLGKFNLFLVSWSEGEPLGKGLAICMAINAAIAAWYYLRLVALMYLEPVDDGVEEADEDWFAWTAGAVCAVATIVLFFDPQRLWAWL